MLSYPHIHLHMPKSSACLNARASLQEIRTLKRDFVVAYDRAVTSQTPVDIIKAQELKQKCCRRRVMII